MQKRPPKVFICYSYDSKKHRAWVTSLATHLSDDGIEVLLDKWRDKSRSIDEFMIAALDEAEFVVFICTPKFRSNIIAHAKGKRLSGSGFELAVAAAYRRMGADKDLIAVLASGEWEDAAPPNILGDEYYDLRNNDGANYVELRERLLGYQDTPPELGPRAEKSSKETPLRLFDTYKGSIEIPPLLPFSVDRRDQKDSLTLAFDEIIEPAKGGPIKIPNALFCTLRSPPNERADRLLDCFRELTVSDLLENHHLPPAVEVPIAWPAARLAAKKKWPRLKKETFTQLKLHVPDDWRDRVRDSEDCIGLINKSLTVRARVSDISSGSVELLEQWIDHWVTLHKALERSYTQQNSALATTGPFILVLFSFEHVQSRFSQMLPFFNKEEKRFIDFLDNPIESKDACINLTRLPHLRPVAVSELGTWLERHVRPWLAKEAKDGALGAEEQLHKVLDEQFNFLEDNKTRVPMNDLAASLEEILKSGGLHDRRNTRQIGF